jgi:PPOX class F420-dependent enzyme/OxyR family protein
LFTDQVDALTDTDIAYLESQFLGRLATAGTDGKPHVVPVGVFYNREHGTVDIGGYRFGERKKYRDVQRNPFAAVVIDDLVSAEPWVVRMLEVRGRAEALTTGGRALRDGFADEMIRIHPDKVNRYNLDPA